MKTNSENLIYISFRLPREQIEFIRFLQNKLSLKTRSDVLRQLIQDYMLGYIEKGLFSIDEGKNEN